MSIAEKGDKPPEGLVPNPKLRLREQLREVMRFKHHSPRTEQAYWHWIRRFILHHAKRHPKDMGEPEVTAFLSHLAAAEDVAVATQNQALNALVFLYRELIHRPLGQLGPVERPQRPARLPEVLSREEVRRLLLAMSGTTQLMARLLYGTGLRLIECLRLRVKDVDFERGQILVRSGKGAKDRSTMLPESLRQSLVEHLARVKALHEQDLADGLGWVALPEALRRKLPQAEWEWPWQWVFPSAHRSLEPGAERLGRHHTAERGLQRAVKVAAVQAKLTRRVTCHTKSP